jgi:hypothetical protein
VEGIRTFTGTRTKKITMVSRLERESLIVELDEKTTRVKNSEIYQVYCFSILNGDNENLERAIFGNRMRSRMMDE